MEVVQEERVNDEEEENTYNEAETMQEHAYGEEDDQYQFRGPDNMVLEVSQDDNRVVSSPGIMA